MILLVEKKISRYSPEFREQVVRLLDEHRSDSPSLSAACREIGGKLGCSGDTLHDWWKQTRRDRELMAHIRRIWHDNRAVYGTAKSGIACAMKGGR